MILLGGFGLSLNAQKYFTKQGDISFYSDAPTEKIEAFNHKATCVIDLETGNMQWAVLIKAFEFKKALMQEHFNENYMESSKFPKANFKGSIKGFEDKDWSSNGTFELPFEGELTVHGVDKQVDGIASFTIADGMIKATSKLIVKCSDFDISIPKVVEENIAKQIELTISANLKKL